MEKEEFDRNYYLTQVFCVKQLSDCPLIIARFSAPPFFVRPLSDMRSIAGYVPNGGQQHGGKGPVEIGKLLVDSY